MMMEVGEIVFEGQSLGVLKVEVSQSELLGGRESGESYCPRVERWM